MYYFFRDFWMLPNHFGIEVLPSPQGSSYGHSMSHGIGGSTGEIGRKEAVELLSGLNFGAMAGAAFRNVFPHDGTVSAVRKVISDGDKVRISLPKPLFALTCFHESMVFGLLESDNQLILIPDSGKAKHGRIVPRENDDIVSLQLWLAGQSLLEDGDIVSICYLPTVDTLLIRKEDRSS